MTDAEKQLIDAVLMWQQCRYPMDRPLNLKAVREAAFKVAQERAPRNSRDVFKRLILARTKLPREVPDPFEWESIFDQGYGAYLKVQGDDEPFWQRLGPYRQITEEEKALFIEYFDSRSAAFSLGLPPSLFDYEYEGALDELGITEEEP